VGGRGTDGRKKGQDDRRERGSGFGGVESKRELSDLTGNGAD